MSFKYITSWPWWKAALIRSLRSALVIAVPYIPASYTGSLPYLTILLAAGLGFIVTLLTAIAGLPETDGNGQAWWQAVLSRVVRSVAQGAVAGFGTAVLLTDVDWVQVANYSLAAGFGSLVLATITHLPEVDEVTGEAKIHVNEAEINLPTTEPITVAVEEHTH